MSNNDSKQEISKERMAPLANWPVREDARWDALLCKLPPYFLRSNASLKMLIAEGYEDPNHPFAPKTQEERVYIDEVVRPLKKIRSETKIEEVQRALHTDCFEIWAELDVIGKELDLLTYVIPKENMRRIKEAHEYLLKKVELLDADSSPIMQFLDTQTRNKQKGTKSSQSKPDKRHKKILAKALELDPKKEMSANSLAAELETIFKVSRKTTVKTPAGLKPTKKDTSSKKNGLRKSNIYSLLIKKGWN